MALCIIVLYFFYRFNKLVKDVTKFIQSQEKGPWPQNKISALDRALGEAVRILDKKVRVVSSKIKLKDNKTSLANDFSYQSTMCEFYWLDIELLSGDLYEVCILTCCWSRVNHFKYFYSTSHLSNKAIRHRKYMYCLNNTDVYNYINHMNEWLAVDRYMYISCSSK